MSLQNAPVWVPDNCNPETVWRFVDALVYRIRRRADFVNRPFGGSIISRNGSKIDWDTRIDASWDLLEKLMDVFVRLLTTDVPSITLPELERIIELIDDANINSAFLEFAQHLNNTHRDGNTYISSDNTPVVPFDHQHIRDSILYKLRNQKDVLAEWIEAHPEKSKKGYQDFEGIFVTPLWVYINTPQGLRYIDIDSLHIENDLSWSVTIAGSQYFIFTEKNSLDQMRGYTPHYYDLHGDKVYPELDNERVIFMKTKWWAVYVYQSNWLDDGCIDDARGSIGVLDLQNGMVRISIWLGLRQEFTKLTMQKK